MQAPRWPRQLRPYSPATISDEAEYSELALTGIDLTGQVANAVMFEASHWRQSIFQQTHLTKLRIADVRFENSDFSGAVWEHARLRRVEFIGCRLLGMQLLNADQGDVLFKDCQIEGATFASARVQPAYFENCILRGVSFEAADLTGVKFKKCDLTGADLRGAKLKGADLRGCIINGLQLGAKELQGVVIDQAQATQVATLLGLIVKDDDAVE